LTGRPRDTSFHKPLDLSGAPASARRVLGHIAAPGAAACRSGSLAIRASLHFRSTRACYGSGMANILDVRTRKLADDRVEAIAITDKEDAEGAPIVVRGYGATPDDAVADARAKAETA